MSTTRDAVREKIYEILEDAADLVCDQLEDYGKYKGILMCNGDKSENYIPVSVAKQIVKARGRGGVLGYLKEEGGDDK